MLMVREKSFECLELMQESGNFQYFFEGPKLPQFLTEALPKPNCTAIWKKSW